MPLVLLTQKLQLTRKQEISRFYSTEAALLLLQLIFSTKNKYGITKNWSEFHAIRFIDPEDKADSKTCDSRWCSTEVALLTLHLNFPMENKHVITKNWSEFHVIGLSDQEDVFLIIGNVMIAMYDDAVVVKETLE